MADNISVENKMTIGAYTGWYLDILGELDSALEIYTAVGKLEEEEIAGSDDDDRKSQILSVLSANEAQRSNLIAKKGDLDESLAISVRALEIAEQSDVHFRIMARNCSMALALFRKAKYDEAWGHAEKAIEMHKDNNWNRRYPHPYNTKGFICKKLMIRGEMPKLAISHATTTIELLLSEPSPWFQAIGMEYWAKGLATLAVGSDLDSVAEDYELSLIHI